MEDYRNIAQKRFETFKKIVEENGEFFLGIWTGNDRTEHLVITQEKPLCIEYDQLASFVFPWTSTLAGGYFLAPKYATRLKVLPIGEHCSIWMTVEKALECFHDAAIKFPRKPKFFIGPIRQ